MFQPVQPIPTREFPKLPAGASISIIGMAGAGKSTVGRALAKMLDWSFVDSDYLIEATYGAVLQQVADALDKEAFLDLEATIIGQMQLKRCVVATGGSVVYRPDSMTHLAKLGPIVHLDVPLSIILERIARNPDRGLAIAPGQTIEDLFREREALYRRYATFSLQAAGLSPQECAQAIMAKLAII